jgi:hypothetical protein
MADPSSCGHVKANARWEQQRAAAIPHSTQQNRLDVPAAAALAQCFSSFGQSHFQILLRRPTRAIDERERGQYRALSEARHNLHKGVGRTQGSEGSGGGARSQAAGAADRFLGAHR